jgi:hypothetical protein
MTLRKSTDKFKEIFWLPAILVHLILLVNTKFTLWPEMVVYPYLINRGFLLYRDIINPYPPIFIAFLSIFAKAFGYLPPPYQILTWTVIIVIDLSIFVVVSKISKNYYHAFLALISFIVLSIPFGINGLWFDLIQTPFVIFSIYYFYNYSKSQKVSELTKSLCLVTLALFIKQQVLWLVIFYLAVLLVQSRNKHQRLINNVLLSFAFFCFLFFVHIVFFYKLGTLTDFLFWAVYQPLFKGSSLPGYVSLPTLKQSLILVLPLLISVTLTVILKGKKFIITLLALPLIMFAYPRFDYFHLVPYLAAVAVSLGIHLKDIRMLSIKQSLLPVGFLILLSVFTIHYFEANWHQPVRFFEQDILSAASFLNEVTPKNSVIYIQNGPDQLLPLSDRLPVKPWADEFPWYLEIGNMQQKVTTAITSQNPQFVINKPYENNGKYYLGSYRPGKIADYLNANYVNLIQINSTLWLKVKK